MADRIRKGLVEQLKEARADNESLLGVIADAADRENAHLAEIEGLESGIRQRDEALDNMLNQCANAEEENEKLRAALRKIVVRHKLHPFDPDSVIAQKALSGGDDD